MIQAKSMISRLRRRAVTAAMTATVLMFQFQPGTARADLIDLGIMLDESGSVGSGNYQIAKQALAQALSLIPTDGPNQYRIGVVSFGTLVQTIIPPTVLTAGNRGFIQNQIIGDTFSGGATHMWLALDRIRDDFNMAGGLGDLSLLNMTTDGNPVCAASSFCPSASAFALTETAADNAALAGWDGLSFEAIGNSIDTNFLRSIAFPGPAPLVGPANLPDPKVLGFVMLLSNFSFYEAAIAAKIQKIVEPNPVPVPAAFWLFGTALLGFIGVSRRTRV